MPVEGCLTLRSSKLRCYRNCCVRLALTFIAGLGLIAVAADAQMPFVSPMFGSNMILQRGKTNNIWGWSKPGETVRVELAGQTAGGMADANGRWQVQLPPLTIGNPLTLRVTGSQTVVFTNILAGDVWLCGGQSNMELPLSRARNGDTEVKAADHPNLRLFTVKSLASYAPADVVQGTWKVCTPQTATEDGGVSAVAYFFARKIQSETNVPIGLIKDCWGGTTAESWTSAGALRPIILPVPICRVGPTPLAPSPRSGRSLPRRTGASPR